MLILERGEQAHAQQSEENYMSSENKHFDLPDGSVDFIEALRHDDIERFWLKNLGVDMVTGLSWASWERSLTDLYRIADEKSRPSAWVSFVRQSVIALPEKQREELGDHIINYATRLQS